ncbi:MAG: putative lipopolysaccharide heptosyltransferase III [Verrucomicrobiota bacterium]|nr:putative lipopolysaccharide heptosyltransferase III [Verrucomicrobiota bacterium]
MRMNILLIQLKRIGDLILTTPAIAAVRAKFADADISLIVSAGCGDLLPAIPAIDRAFIARGTMSDAASWFSVARHRFDYSLDFTRNDRSAFITLLSGAKRRITADHPRQREKIRALSYNTVVDIPIGLMHTVDYHLALLQPLGIRDASPLVTLNLPSSATERAQRVLQEAGISGDFVLLHPGSARAEKFWEADRWAALVGFAAERGLPCVVTGGSSIFEQGHIAHVKARAKHAFVDLSGQADLLTLGALIQRARLLVTVDSAPMHFAAATQTPQIVLFGPTNPLHWHPRFTPALILLAGEDAPLTGFSPKQKPVAMNLISTEQVIDGMKTLLAAPRLYL